MTDIQTKTQAGAAVTHLLSELTTLQQLANVRARAAIKEVKEVLPQTENSTDQPQPTSSGTYYWKRGTGYGNDNGSSAQWDVQSFLNTAAEKQKKITASVTTVTQLLSTLLEQKTTEELDAVFQDSCLVPFLVDRISTSGAIEMQRHKELFTAVLELCRVLTTRTSVLQLPVFPDQSNVTLWTTLRTAKQNAKKAIAREEKLAARLAAASDDAASDAKDQNAIAKMVVEVTGQMKEALGSDEDSSSEEEDAAPDAKLENTDIPVEDTPADEPVDAPADAPAAAIEEKKREFSEEEQKARDAELVEILQDLRYDEVENFTHHKYVGSNTNEVYPRAFIRRVAHEYADLGDSLPCVAESSIFFRSHEEDLSKAQMLIIAPPDTPYGGGCFLFDISLPSSYPNAAPQCNLQTTGGGSVRFNPNLYECGKVCLSLLGTWQGDASEKWNPKTSTLLQLAVSIQSLIFVPEPYFNEPGYEEEMDTPYGKTSSDSYNQNIERATLQWAMIDMLRKPPSGFEEIIRAHFRLRKDVVLEQCRKWDQLPNRNLGSLLSQFEAELAKL